VNAREELLSTFAWQGGHADVWRVFDDGSALAAVVAGLVEPWRSSQVTKVCGIESRGFILGGAAALQLGTGFVAIRKLGALFPGPKRSVEAGPDYRGLWHVFQVQERAVGEGDRVLLVDDWIERGSQALAARELIEQCGGELVGIAVMVDQLGDDVRIRLPPVTSIVAASELPPSA
jgi:adenine phosphoribosyltransferase